MPRFERCQSVGSEPLETQAHNNKEGKGAQTAETAVGNQQAETHALYSVGRAFTHGLILPPFLRTDFSSVCVAIALGSSATAT